MANRVRNTSKPQNVLAKENNINRKVTDELLPALPSFVADYDRYLDAEGRSVKTRYAYIKDISYFLEYMISGSGLSVAEKVKDVTLQEIERLKGKDINDYLVYTKQYEADDGTIMQNGSDSRARKKSSIVGLLKYLYRQDLIEHDVTGKVMQISVRQSNRAVKVLQENEMLDLLDVVSTGNGLSDRQKRYWEKTRYRDTLILALFTIAGLRLSELQQLNISSFNLKREEFTIYRKRGKESIIPMNATILTIYNDYMEMDRGRCTNVASGHEDALFLCLKSEEKDSEGNRHAVGRKRLSERQIQALVHKYTAVIMGDGGYSPHKLRATAATTAINRGNDITRVASLLDHDSVTTTQRYINVTEEDRRKVLESMEISDTKRKKI